MNADQLTECMHAVLDGEATPEQAHALQERLAVDAAARHEFEAWRALFKGLDEMPAGHPPEGLVAAIDAALPAAGARTTRKPAPIFNQLFARPPVIGSGPTQAWSWSLRSTFRRLSGRGTSQEFGHMNANRKILAGGAVAAVALGVAVFLSGYPPKAENVTGTVIPAERYRAPQAGAEAIKLGVQAGTSSVVQPAQSGVEAAKTEADAAEANRSRAGQADAGAAEANRSKTAKAEVGAAEANRSKTAKTEADAAEANRSRADKADAGAAEANRTRLQSAEAGAAQVNRSKADATAQR